MIAATEVTQGQWKAVMGTTPWQGKERVLDDDLRPAIFLSLNDGEKFCQLLSEKEGRVYRMPTEAEWEFACRAGTQTSFSFGDNPSDLIEHGWTSRVGKEGPQRVATRKPNPWGLFDMHGNAWEWCDDVFEPYSSEAATDPTTQGRVNGPIRVTRGGGVSSVFWMDHRSAYRGSWPGGLSNPCGAIRPIRTLVNLQAGDN